MPNRTCFVLMPFDRAFDGIWTIIGKTVRAAGDRVSRADDVFAPGTIINDILSAIRTADYLIADLSGRNPNVFYELGHAIEQAKPVILIAQKIDDVPFDLRHRRIIPYADTTSGGIALESALSRSIASV